MSPRAAWRLESLGFAEVYDYAPGKQDWTTAGLPTERADDAPRAGDLAREDTPTCRLDERLGDVRERVRAAGFDTCMVVNDRGVLLGRVRPEELDADPDARVEDVMRAGPTTFRPTVHVVELAKLLADHDLPHIPVTTNDGVLLGLVLRDDARRAAEEEHQRHEHRA